MPSGTAGIKRNVMAYSSFSHSTGIPRGTYRTFSTQKALASCRYSPSFSRRMNCPTTQDLFTSNSIPNSKPPVSKANGKGKYTLPLHILKTRFEDSLSGPFSKISLDCLIICPKQIDWNIFECSLCSHCRDIHSLSKHWVSTKPQVRGQAARAVYYKKGTLKRCPGNSGLNVWNEWSVEQLKIHICIPWKID